MSHHLVRSHTLTKSSLKTVAAAVVLSALAATPVFAQAAIQEPGAFAFYHPYLDVLNGGAPTPAAKLILEGPAALQAYAARESGVGFVDNFDDCSVLLAFTHRGRQVQLRASARDWRRCTSRKIRGRRSVGCRGRNGSGPRSIRG